MFKRYILLTIKLLGILGFCIFFMQNCKTDSSAIDVNCIDCHLGDLDSSDLEVQFTLNEENTKVPVIIYFGKLEKDYKNQRIALIDTISVTKKSFRLKVDNYYTVKAEYKWGNKTVYAIDGNNFKKTKIETCYDDEICWIMSGETADVRINY